MSTHSLFAGAAADDVTAPLSIPHLGLHPQRYGRFTGIHDPLRARALVVGNDSDHIAILSVDALGLANHLLGFGRDFIAELRQRASAGTALRPETILIAATHAHSTPETYGILRLWEQPGFIDWADDWCTQLATIIRRAWDDLAPANLAFGESLTTGLVRNRREGLASPHAQHPVDAAVRVLRFNRKGHAGIVLANAACHPVTVQVQPLVSADFPGLACMQVEQALGAGSQCLFLQGAAGDLNPVCGNSKDWSDVASSGLILGRAILEAVHQAQPLSTARRPIPLTWATRHLHLASRALPDPAPIEAEWQALEKRLQALPPMDPECEVLGRRRTRLDEIRRLLAFGSEPIAAEVQALGIGPAAILGIPGELFCALGNAIRERHEQRELLLATLANGCIGYLPSRSDWETGGYETSLGAWCRAAPGESERLVAEASALLIETR